MKSENNTQQYFNFELGVFYYYELRQFVNRSQINIKRGKASSWDEMVEILDSIKPLQNYNVPIIGTVESAVGLQNIYTGVLRQISLAEFNTSKSDVKLDPRLDFFVCRGDRQVPTVRDIKEFIGDCSNCGSYDFCKKRLKLKDEDPAYFDMSCMPCIRPLNTDKDIIYYTYRSGGVDSKMRNFFTEPINLQIVSPIVMMVGKNMGVVK